MKYLFPAPILGVLICPLVVNGQDGSLPELTGRGLQTLTELLPPEVRDAETTYIVTPRRSPPIRLQFRAEQPSRSHVLSIATTPREDSTTPLEDITPYTLSPEEHARLEELAARPREELTPDEIQQLSYLEPIPVERPRNTRTRVNTRRSTRPRLFHGRVFGGLFSHLR